MQGPTGDDQFAVLVKIKVGEMHDKRQVVRQDRGAEEQGTILAEPEEQAREVPCALVVETLLAKTERLDVAEPVEDSEGFVAFQDPRAVIGQRGGSEDIVLSLDGDDVGPKTAPAIRR